MKSVEEETKKRYAGGAALQPAEEVQAVEEVCKGRC